MILPLSATHVPLTRSGPQTPSAPQPMAVPAPTSADRVQVGALPGEARALFTELRAEGWTLESGCIPAFRNPRAGVPRFDPIDIDRACTIVENPGPLDPMNPPRAVHLTSPDGRRIDLANGEDVRAFGFFERGHPADTLADPALARRLADLAARGYDVCSSGWNGQPGPLGAYSALRMGYMADARVGELRVADLRQPDDVSLPAFEQQLRPAALAGEIDPGALGTILEALPEPRDASGFLALAASVSRGPAAVEPLAERTKHALAAWASAVKRPAELPVFERLLATVSGEAVDAPARYLVDGVRALPVAVSRDEREQVFWHVVAGPFADAERATEAIVRRPPSASLDERVDAYDTLRAAAGRDVTRDFETLAACAGPDLRADAERYARVLSTAVLRKEDAAEAWACLVDVCRARGWQVDEALPVFLSLWLERHTAREAVAELSVRPSLAPREGGRVEQVGEQVRIGGITIPVRQA